MRKADDGITYPLPSDGAEPGDGTSLGESRQVRLYGRSIRFELTPSARAASVRLTAPLVADMELYFSCFVRKAVRFHPPQATDEALPEARLTEYLTLRFRPVTTRHCAMSATDELPLETLAVLRPHAFVPRWVKLDYRRGTWSGEFGY